METPAVARRGRHWPWSALGLEGPVDLRSVKRAYAARLKEIDRSDPDAFGALRDAFDRAKQMAETNAPARPAMREIAAGNAATAPLPTEAPPAPQAPPPGKAAPPDPPEPEPSAAPTAATLRKQRAAAPKPAGASPWMIPIESLDALLQSDPAQANAVFWSRFDRAIAKPLWDLDDLEALARTEMASDLSRRRAMEAKIYQALSTQITAPERGYPTPMARFVEAQFAWSEDGVGASKRLGFRSNLQLIMYAHALSRPMPERSLKERLMPLDPKWGYLKVGTFLLLWLVSLRGQAIQSPYDVLVQVLALMLFFAITMWLMRGLAALARGLLRVTRLAGLAQRLFAAAMPETEARLQRSAEARSYAMFLATAIALGAMFVAGTLAG
ncbi:MAG: hypothetical protein AAGF60_13485 [Pseudomonadota bacterium]